MCKVELVLLQHFFSSFGVAGEEATALKRTKIEAVRTRNLQNSPPLLPSINCGRPCIDIVDRSCGSCRTTMPLDRALVDADDSRTLWTSCMASSVL